MEHINIPIQWKESYTKYPHGFTIFEAITAWANQVNVMIDKMNLTEDQVNKLFTDTLPENVENVLNAWYTSGQLADLINIEVLANIPYNMKRNGCIGDGVANDSIAIQSVIDSLVDQGTLQFDNGTYKLDNNIDFKGKSIKVITSEKVDFTGVGKFPSFSTNPFHQMNGNNIKVSPQVGRTDGGINAYGDAAISAEITPGNDYVGNAVGGFFSAKSGASNGGLWALNAIAAVDEGFTGFVTACEIDLDTHSTTVARTCALGITGIGEHNVNVGISLERANTTKYENAIEIRDANTGIQVFNASDVGFVADTPTNVGFYTRNCGVNGVQIVDSKLGILISNVENGIDIKNITTGVGINIESGGLAFGPGSTPLKKYRKIVNIFTFESIPAHSTADVFFAITGATGDDSVNVNPAEPLQSGLMWNSRMNGGSVVLRIANITPDAITPNAVNWIIDLWQH